MQLQLRFSGFHYDVLKEHLLPADGKEAVAVALCGRYFDGHEHILMVHDLTLIPHNECSNRENDILCWSTEKIRHYFERISQSDFAILKIHSHPGGYDNFSDTDDRSDHEFFDSAFGWATTSNPHASAIMLPDGKVFGRCFFSDLHYEPIDRILVSGDTIELFTNNDYSNVPAFAERNVQAFGEKTHQILNKLSAAVVGCSGTGSPIVEQLVRLGIGKIVLIDPDVLEEKNLNRIINATKSDAEIHLPKVSVLSTAINRIDLGTQVQEYQVNLYDNIEALKAIAKSDIVFGCMDSVDGRYLLNQLSTFYLLPYFDLGVRLEADGTGGIEQICGTVHYIQPGKSSLISRGLYTMEDVRAAGQYRKNPEVYEDLKKNAYIKNVNVNRPAVISINMQIASHAILDLLNRLHSFKTEAPASYAMSTIDMSSCYMVNVHETDLPVDTFLRSRIGRGDITPFLEMPELNQ